jgi:hypothetical protein
MKRKGKRKSDLRIGMLDLGYGIRDVAHFFLKLL